MDRVNLEIRVSDSIDSMRDSKQRMTKSKSALVSTRNCSLQLTPISDWLKAHCLLLAQALAECFDYSPMSDWFGLINFG